MCVGVPLQTGDAWCRSGFVRSLKPKWLFAVSTWGTSGSRGWVMHCTWELRQCAGTLQTWCEQICHRHSTMPMRVSERVCDVRGLAFISRHGAWAWGLHADLLGTLLGFLGITSICMPVPVHASAPLCASFYLICVHNRQ